jgi:serine/threonine protein kinase
MAGGLRTNLLTHVELPERYVVLDHVPGAASHPSGAPRIRCSAEALDFAHSSGVVHRDIRPANLLLDRDGVLHIGDFGIARLLSEDTTTATGQLLGTAAYLAPEQALGQSASAASDRYALAGAAFELLVGARPFTAEHFAAQDATALEARGHQLMLSRSYAPAIGVLDHAVATGLVRHELELAMEQAAGPPAGGDHAAGTGGAAVGTGHGHHGRGGD